jgi:hypothetical protein
MHHFQEGALLSVHKDDPIFRISSSTAARQDHEDHHHLMFATSSERSLGDKAEVATYAALISFWECSLAESCFKGLLLVGHSGRRRGRTGSYEGDRLTFRNTWGFPPNSAKRLFAELPDFDLKIGLFFMC